MANALSGSDSQASTPVHAPACTTTSGRTVVMACMTASRSETSRSARGNATTSSSTKEWMRSRPSCPPAPVTRTFTACSRRLERFPPPPVLPVPVDRLLQRLVERALLAPAEGGDLRYVDGVATVVALAVL